MNNPLEKINRNTGMTVPDDFFDNFAINMAESLPPTEFESKREAPARPKTLWSKVRTYVYMAAMFAGIWLMMNMFTLFSPVNTQPIDAGSQLLARLTENTTYVDDYTMDQISDTDFYDELYQSGFDPTSLKID